MANQMEKKIEHEMATRFYIGFYIGGSWSLKENENKT